MDKDARLAVATAAVVALLPALAGADVSGLTDAQPAGIQPPAISLRTALAAYRRALGVRAPGTPETLIEHRSVNDGNTTGFESIVRSGDDERIDETIGSTSTSSGSLGGRDWSMNANGEVVIEQGIHRAVEIDRAAVRAAIGAQAVRGVTLLGRISQPIDAYVIKVDPPGGVLEYLYIDAHTWVLDANVLSYADHADRYTYDDYRSTLGLSQPWHIHLSIDDVRRGEYLQSHEVDTHVNDVRVGAPVDPREIAIPQTRSIVSFGQPRSTLPGKIIGDRVILPLQIGARTVNLQLDSGAAGIFVDDGIIQALGYPSTDKDATVPSMTVGGLAMHNVHVTTLPFADLADAETPVAGLIGFDFIDSVVLHVDYANGSVEAIDPQTFTPPAGAVTIPVTLDDMVPAIAAGIGSASHLRFLVDTGADSSVLFPSFASAHPEALAQSAIGAEMEASFPFVGAFGAVGGLVQYEAVETGPLNVAQWTFATWPFNLTHNASTFEMEDYDGILGQDFLRYYDLYLDYPHGRILLAPNARYTERFGT